jgi:hypothetical protein
MNSKKSEKKEATKTPKEKKEEKRDKNISRMTNKPFLGLFFYSSNILKCMPARKYLALALMIGMLLGYGWQSVATSIATSIGLRGIYLLIKKMVHFFQWVLEKLKKIIGFN